MFGNVRVYVYVYTYNVCIYTYIYVHYGTMCIYIHIYIYIHIHIHISIHVLIFLSVYLPSYPRYVWLGTLAPSGLEQVNPNRSPIDPIDGVGKETVGQQ